MHHRFLMLILSVVFAWAKEIPRPSEFYIASVFFSDNGALLYYRLVDVTRDRDDSVIRYFRVAPLNVYCPRLIVQKASVTVRGSTPAQLLGERNPCALKPQHVRHAINQYRRGASILEAISFGIVAQCGAKLVAIDLPDVQGIDLERMRISKPEIVALWDVASQVTNSAFGSKDPFNDRTEEDDLGLQREGQRLLPQLTSGRYDQGLALAARGNVGNSKAPTFRELLRDYTGPISVSAANSSSDAHLVDAESLRFDRFTAPPYPPLARQARIQGKVELELEVNPSTGEIRRVSALSGHPLLKPSAVEAAKRWRLAVRDGSPETLKVVLDYSLRCP